ncbi:MAG: peptidase S9, partial [Gemmatimonadetes bacterium]|nr:peptidase S9 [Gemmatimonadota bacterium]
MSAVTRFRAAAALLALCAGTTALLPAPTQAQYFGRNKVQYRTFDFRILRTTHFDIYYYPEEEQAARDVARMNERWYARLSRILEHEFEARQPFVLYASHPHFQQTSTLSGDISEGTGGVTEAFKQRIILPMAHSYEETDHVVGHELVHAFQYDISGLGRAGGGLEQAAQRFQVPGWFVEGMAEYLSVGPVDPHTAMWLRDAALTGRIPTLEQLTYDPSFFPYRWGQAFWAYVGGRWGDAAIGQILKQVGQGVPFPEAFQRILNVPLEDIVDDWGTSIRRTYLPLLADRREAREEARPLITLRTEGGRINLGPSLSPDGTKVAFLSELEFLDVELYIANAQTGEIIRRLVRGTAFDPHFGSLRYINSAGSWSPDSRMFAFSALRGGRDVLVIMNAVRGGRLEEFAIPNVDEIANPTWSPDGTTIVVSGLSGGVTDLYAVNARTGAARRLTNDRFADMQPSFSPDGRTVAFTTDRGETDFDQLSFGEYRIGLMDFATGEIRTLPRADGGKNINPQWTRDGRGLYVVSDREGINNVYRIELATGALTQVTNLFTGVSGITDLSPAISSSPGADMLVFTAYERGGFNIYSITNPTELAGTAPEPVQVAAAGLPGVPLPALLPPVPRPEDAPFNRVLLSINEYQSGLPDAAAVASWEVRPYTPRLSLDYLGQPQIGASASTGGGFNRGGLYGGITGIFSDVLGRHTVFGTVQAQGQIEEIGFSTLYLNQASRWTWGVSAQRIPYVIGRYAAGQTQEGFIQQELRYRYFDTRVAGLTQYPFSQVQRMEFSAGARRIASDVIIREVLSGAGGQRYDERRIEGRAYNLAEGSAALVYDNSLQGYTSPFAGQRYRFEVSPTVGTAQFTSVTGDYRRYFFLRPFTLAVRGMHVGRYGRDEHLVGNLYLGWPFLMRGYGQSDVRDACSRDFERNQEGALEGTECTLYRDELIGTRIGVANVELRVPVIGQLVLGNSIGLPPVEGFAFADAGTAWGNTLLQDLFTGDQELVRTSPNFRRGVAAGPGDRGVLTSVGVGGRVNLFGYAVLEAVYVNPLERQRGWHWQFALQPG